MRSGLTHRRAIIVGAGQAGLAVAAALIGLGFRPQQEFVVVDAATDRQRSWASRWHSMRLLSDARHSTLPVRPLPVDPHEHPRADEIANYLDQVQHTLGVDPFWGLRVVGVERVGHGSVLQLQTAEGDVQTRNVVCATGAATHPRIPAWAQQLRVPGVVLHSAHYQFPRQVPTGRVLIVGGGNSGVQLARELSASHEVTLAVRTRRPHRPARTFPVHARAGSSWLGRPPAVQPVFGDSYHALRHAGVAVAPAVTGADGGQVTFADGSTLAPDSVILATGYDPGEDWLPAEATAARSRPAMTGLPGLFVAGIPAHSRPGSDTLAGVSRDAAVIARTIADRP